MLLAIAQLAVMVEAELEYILVLVALCSRASARLPPHHHRSLRPDPPQRVSSIYSIGSHRLFLLVFPTLRI